jgi:hypothetical protein
LKYFRSSRLAEDDILKHLDLFFFEDETYFLAYIVEAERDVSRTSSLCHFVCCIATVK